MKSDKEKKRFLRGDETQRLSAGMQPDSYALRFIYGGPPTGRQKKDPYPAVQIRKIQKFFLLLSVIGWFLTCSHIFGNLLLFLSDLLIKEKLKINRRQQHRRESAVSYQRGDSLACIRE